MTASERSVNVLYLRTLALHARRLLRGEVDTLSAHNEMDAIVFCIRCAVARLREGKA